MTCTFADMSNKSLKINIIEASPIISYSLFRYAFILSTSPLLMSSQSFESDFIVTVGFECSSFTNVHFFSFMIRCDCCASSPLNSNATTTSTSFAKALFKPKGIASKVSLSVSNLILYFFCLK